MAIFYIIVFLLLAISGVLIFYKTNKKKEIKEWVWMGFGKDPFNDK